MHEHGSLPRARQDGLLEETVGEELLLYDQESHTAHCLSPIAACVWRHCDGEHDMTELAELTGASESLVADALNELREKDLLDAKHGLMQNTIPGESRREAIVRVTRYGAAAASASMIVSATAATPAMASSSPFEEDKKGWECHKVTGLKKNCCRCDPNGFACGGINVQTEASCKKECEEVLGQPLFEWVKEAECVPL
jgi:hypothetical protein